MYCHKEYPQRVAALLCTRPMVERLTIHLVGRSQWFDVEPLPGGVWELMIKEEALDLIPSWIREAVEVQV